MKQSPSNASSNATALLKQPEPESELELQKPSPALDLYEQRDRVADVLKAHQPTTHQERRVHRCACGLEFHFVDAKAWHRHAAVMVLGELLGRR